MLIGSCQVNFTADELYGTALTSRGALSATNKITDAYFKPKQEILTQNAATHLGLYYGPKPHLITAKKQLTRWSFSNEDDGNKKGEKSNKSSIKSPGGPYFKHICRGGGGFFNLAKTIVSVLHKELECGVEKLKYEKLEIMQPGGKRKVKSFLIV